MDVRLALIAVSACLAVYGCATPEKESGIPVAAPKPSVRYLTGSRLPLREEDTGAAPVISADKDAYDEAARSLNLGSTCRHSGGC